MALLARGFFTKLYWAVMKSIYAVLLYAIKLIKDRFTYPQNKTPIYNQLVEFFSVGYFLPIIFSVKCFCLQSKPLCKYGSECYQTNPKHLEQFYHPPKVSLTLGLLRTGYRNVMLILTM